MTARPTVVPLHPATPARLHPAPDDELRDDVLLPVLGLAVGLVPWIGLRLAGHWSQPELAVAGVMALAAAAELVRLAVQALRS